MCTENIVLKGLTLLNDQHILRYFLGGNTSDGFYSLYDGFVSQKDGDFLWIIKGGAGCGKSSFMRRIGAAGERAGYSVEYAVCSGDPDSLDGVYIPELKIAYMDGTSPHVTDAKIAAVDSAYIDLGAFYQREALAGHKAELEKLTADAKAQYVKAYSLLSAAGSLRMGWQEKLASGDERQAALARVKSLAQREFGKKTRAQGKIKKRFISALTCKGLVTLPELSENLCTRMYTFENRYLLGNAAISCLAESAASAGYDVILCPDPLTPELLEALFVPALSLGFKCGGRGTGSSIKGRNIRLDRSVGSGKRRELRACEHLCEGLRSEAYASLLEAKRLHDAIESIYNPNVDFDGVYELVAKHIAQLGLK